MGTEPPIPAVWVAYVYVRDTSEPPAKLVGQWETKVAAASAVNQVLTTARTEGFLYPRDFDPTSVEYAKFVPYHAIDEVCVEPIAVPAATLKRVVNR